MLHLHQPALLSQRAETEGRCTSTWTREPNTNTLTARDCLSNKLCRTNLSQAQRDWLLQGFYWVCALPPQLRFTAKPAHSLSGIWFNRSNRHTYWSLHFHKENQLLGHLNSAINTVCNYIYLLRFFHTVLINFYKSGNNPELYNAGDSKYIPYSEGRCSEIINLQKVRYVKKITLSRPNFYVANLQAIQTAR